MSSHLPPRVALSTGRAQEEAAASAAEPPPPYDQDDWAEILRLWHCEQD
jgi:hypothetical protein